MHLFTCLNPSSAAQTARPEIAAATIAGSCGEAEAIAEVAILLAAFGQEKAAAQIVLVSLHWGVHIVRGSLAEYQIAVAHAAIEQPHVWGPAIVETDSFRHASA